MLTIVIFTLYTIIAAIFTAIVLTRLKNLQHQWSEDAMAVLCRIGILFLTFGTVLDNGRTVFGNIYQKDSDTYTWINTAVSWFCVLNHQWFASLCIMIPCSFIQKLVQTDRWKRLTPRIAVGLFVLLFIVGGAGVIMKMPNPLIVQTDCGDVDPVSKLAPSKKVPTSLLSVFAYQIGMVFAGFIMIIKYGCRGDNLWHVIFLVANFLCLLGQPLVKSLGPYYECYGSNFWEQLTFGSAIFADMVLNTTGSGLDQLPLSEDDGMDYKQVKE